MAILDRIKAWCGDKAYREGLLYYQNGRLLGFRQERDPGQGIRLCGTVIARGRTLYHPSVRIGLHGDWRGSCECSRAACAHQAALILRHVFGPVQESGETPRETDRAASLMLAQYAAKQTAAVMGGASGGGQKIRLEPTLVREPSRMELTLRLGRGRMYIVKDIVKFVSDVEDGKQAAYGKNLEFVHVPESFDADCAPLLRFLIETVEATLAVHGRVYGGLASNDKRRLILSPSALDAFFDLYTGGEVLMDTGRETRPVRLVREDPSLRVELRESGDGILLEMEPAGVTAGARCLYLLRGDRLARCSEEYAQKTAPFLRCAKHGTLFIAGRDLGEFCESVLPEIRETLDVSGGGKALEENMPRELEVLLFLDAPSRDKVVCTVRYRYGSDEFNPYNPTDGGAVRGRNRRSETAAEIRIRRWLDGYNPKLHQLYLEGGDEKMFAFFDEGIPMLMEFAEVHGTGRFRRAGILPPPQISVGVSLKSGLLDVAFDVGEFPTEELGALLGAYRSAQKYYRLKDGRFQSIDGGPLDGLAQIADGLDLSPAQLASGSARVPAFRAAYLDRVLHEREDLRFDRDGAFKRLARGLKSVEDSDYDVPGRLAGVLRNYQRTGFRWLKTMEACGFGGILADDMGLGKTVQIIALLLSAAEEGKGLPSLVVCPASLVLNWVSEINRFAPPLPVRTAVGETGARRCVITAAGPGDVVVTSYDLLRRDIEAYADIQFHYVIIDEAQYIKNAATQNAKCVKAVRSEQRFALTGTPVENRLSELWSIFDFLMPGYLFSYAKFRERIELPAVRGRDEKAVERLRRMAQPFILRRMKRDVLAELPDKTETEVFVRLEGEQRRLYAANAARMSKEVRERLEAGGFEQGGRMEVLAMLTRLRQLCCDPGLCCEGYAGGSAKLDACLELVRESLDSGHRLLIFSQFTSMLARIEGRLDDGMIPYRLLKGDTPRDKRQRMTEEFNRGEGAPVFLVSLKAGGVGLNLTGADVVVHYDPWWNAAAQDQATGRAHRIGQKKSVQVYKLIAQGTIEERILRLQQAKADLAGAVVRDGGESLFAMDNGEFLELFSSDGA